MNIALTVLQLCNITQSYVNNATSVVVNPFSQLPNTTLPGCVFENLPWAKTIMLSNNELIGTIPKFNPTIIESNLTYFSLNNNSLTGTIPPSFGYLHNLEWLDLSLNRLTGGLQNLVNNTKLKYPFEKPKRNQTMYSIIDI